jgi:predicted RNase H-like nuclease
MPIGLPTTGSRRCDIEARGRLGRPRGSSVFPAPVRGCLEEGSYQTLLDLHRRIDKRGLTRQAYFILPKIREVDRYLTEDVSRQQRVREVHPELSFTVWNGGRAMTHRKISEPGRIERERLIDREWRGERERLWAACLRGHGCGRDDLNDAFAVLWTARRISTGQAVRIPDRVELDARGLRMEIVT